MIAPGLALEQAPPLAAPLRFFLTAPLFLFAAGLAAAFTPEWAATPAAPAALALTHLLTLGFLGMSMAGALTQMLPVVAGAPIPAVAWVARISHGALAAGTPALAWGLGTGHADAISLGMAVLGAGLLVFFGATAISLARARRTDTVQAMRLAVLALAITGGLGLGLAGWLSGHWLPDDPVKWLRGHVLWGLAGWVGVLVMGTAWQVVPMLQLTPPYPPRLTRHLVAGAALFLPAAAWLPAPWRMAGEAGVAIILAIFALTTLRLQGQRKRKLKDATLDFWRLGLACLILALALALLPLPDPAALLAGILFLVGFAVSVVNGMLYKIVPFLAWFHLQAQKGFMAGGLPSMRDYLPEERARGQFRLHSLALACLLATPLIPFMALPGGLLFAASATWMAVNLLRAHRLFRAAGGHPLP